MNRSAALVLLALAVVGLARAATPAVTQIIPAPGSTVSSLDTVEVFFSTDVGVVDAADLLINGQPASKLESFGYAHYLFHFTSPAAGLVEIAWALQHDIHDRDSNYFAGGSWTVTINPQTGFESLGISEFMAANSHTTNDIDGDSSDWIELFNPETYAVNLDGYFLTDDSHALNKWRFPSYVMPPNSYLLVWASGKDRTNVAAPLHTNFKLNDGGEYLALVGSGGNILSEFAPKFPPHSVMTWSKLALA